MSSRQEEKERRRKERLEREQADAKRAAHRKRLQLAFGGLLAVAAIAGIVVVVLISTGGDSGGGPAKASDATNVKLPEQATSDINAAAKAAGCTLNNPAYEGANHEQKDFKASDYKQNPPTSGNHFPQWAQDGVYEPSDTPDLGQLVHTLEHGRIDVQYKPGTPAETIAQLETFMKENEDGYHMLLFQNPTNMPFAVAATAWDQQLGCKTMNPKVFDALRTFREAHIDKGPEVVP